MEIDLRIKEPKIITKAEPPSDKERFRSTGMYSTMMSGISPRSDGSGSMHSSTGSASHRSPRLSRA